jgi:gas vesicle protein
MRKSFLLIFIAVMTFSVPCFCAEVEEQEQIDKTWNDIGKQGKQLLKDFGSFFKNAGERVGKDIEGASESAGKKITDTSKQIGNQFKQAAKDLFTVKCKGTWVYKSKRTKTTIIVNEDGTMEITQRTGLDVNYWKGHYSGTAYFLTFDIYMKGKKSFFSDKSKESYETWYITYTVEGDSMTVSSNDIPADESGTNFAEEVVFTKSE